MKDFLTVGRVCPIIICEQKKCKCNNYLSWMRCNDCLNGSKKDE